MKYLNQIPSSWKQIKLKDYLKILDYTKDVDIEDNNFEIIESAFYVFTGQLIQNTNIKPDEVNAIVNRLLFLSDLPKDCKSKLKCKSISELDYQSYINYQKYCEEPIANLIEIVKIFSVEDIDEDKLTVSDAMFFFGLATLKMKKRLKSFAGSLILKTIKQVVKIYWQKIKDFLKMNIKKDGVGY